MRRDRSPWSPFPERRPPKKAPEHGIKVGKLGATWWSQRWIAALERFSASYSARLGRGRTYARAGRVHDLVVSAGKVRAKVTGSGPRPYAVAIDLRVIDHASWRRALEILGAEARFSASLLAGRMPDDIDDAFARAGASLFPGGDGDLSTSCSCPDWANPCKHVAATHYVLGDALDRDPFLLFELRGRTRDAVLAELRALRTGEARQSERPRTRSRGPRSVALGPLDSGTYDRPRAPWPALDLSFEPARRSGTFLAQLGLPPSWRDERKPAELLAPIVASAAARARAIMLTEDEEPE